MTTGQDMSEKMITTDETWEKIKQFGIEKIRNFAESEAIRREISRNGLTENLSDSTERKLTKEELTALCRRMKEHRRRFREYMRMVEETRKKEEHEENSH